MTTDVAALGFQIDSSQAVSARDALNQLAQASVSTAEAAQRTQHAYSQVAAAIRDQTLAAQDFTRANQNASNVLDGLVDRLERLRRGFSAFDGPVTELRRATEQLDAIGRSFGTTASGMENFTRQARQLGMDAAETVQALTRIQAALDNVTSSGRQARQVMENYGVSLTGLSRNDADRALRAFVEAQRGFAADATTMGNLQAVLGPVSPEALMRLSYPAPMTATQRRDQNDAYEANRQLTGTSEQLSATIRQRDEMQTRLSNLRGAHGSAWDWNPFGGSRWDGLAEQLATLEQRERVALARPRTGDPLDWGEAPNTPWTQTRRYRRNNMIIEGVGALDEIEGSGFAGWLSGVTNRAGRRLLNRFGLYNPDTYGQTPYYEYGETEPSTPSDTARMAAAGGGPLVSPNTEGVYSTIRRMEAMSGSAGYRQRREAVWNARQSMGIEGLTEDMTLEQMLARIQGGPRGGERISALNSLFGAFTTSANRDLTRANAPVEALIGAMAGGGSYPEALRAMVAAQAGQGGADLSTRLWTGFQQQLGQGWQGVGNLQFANSQNLMDIGRLSGASPQDAASITRELQIQQQTRQMMLAAEQQEEPLRDRAIAQVRELQDALRSAMNEQDRLNQQAAGYRLGIENTASGQVNNALRGALGGGGAAGAAGLGQMQWMLQNGASVLLTDDERKQPVAVQQALIAQRLNDPRYAGQVGQLTDQRANQLTGQNLAATPSHEAAMILAQAGTSGDPLERIRQMRAAQEEALRINMATDPVAMQRRLQEMRAGWGRDDTQAGASYMFGLQSTNADLLWQLGAYGGGGGGGMSMGGGRGFSPNTAAFSPRAGVNILDVLADLRSATGLNVGYTSHHRPGSGGQHRHGNALDLDLSPFSTDDRQAIARWLAQDGRVGGMGMYGRSDPMLHFDLGQGWNTRRAWGPNGSYTSLGQTPDWFQEIANGFRGGSFASQAGGGAPAGTPRMGTAAGGPGMSAEDIVFGGDWIQAQMAARQGARGTMGVNVDAAAQEQYTQRVLQALVGFEQAIARTTVALRDGEARLATYASGGTTYDRGLLGAQQNDTEYRRIQAIATNRNTPAALRQQAEADLQRRANQIKGSYDQSLDLQGAEAFRNNQWRAEDLEYGNANFLASDYERTRGLSMMRTRRSAMDRYSGMSNRDALVERDVSMAGRLAELEKTQKDLAEIRGTFQSIGELSFQAFGQAARGAMTFRQALQQVTGAASDMLLRLVGRRAMDGIGDWLSKGISSLFGGGGVKPDALPGIADLGMGVHGATGLVFQGGHVVPMATGGIVSAPTYRAMANGGTALIGEAGDEAVLPLKRGPDGRLGVAGAGGGGGPNITVNVSTTGSSGNTAQDHKHAKKVGDEVSRAVEGIVLDVMRKQTRPGGMFGPGGLGSGIR